MISNQSILKQLFSRLITPCALNLVHQQPTRQFASDLISLFCVCVPQGYAAMQEHLSGQVKNTTFCPFYFIILATLFALFIHRVTILLTLHLRYLFSFAQR